MIESGGGDFIFNGGKSSMECDQKGFLDEPSSKSFS